jgi:hypothetical protein
MTTNQWQFFIEASTTFLFALTFTIGVRFFINLWKGE